MVPLAVPGSAPKKRRSVSGEKRRLQKPKAWKHPEPLTRAQLVRMREEFWDTAPHYGGRKGEPAGRDAQRLE